MNMSTYVHDAYATRGLDRPRRWGKTTASGQPIRWTHAGLDRRRHDLDKLGDRKGACYQADAREHKAAAEKGGENAKKW